MPTTMLSKSWTHQRCLWTSAMLFHKRLRKGYGRECDQALQHGYAPCLKVWLVGNPAFRLLPDLLPCSHHGGAFPPVL